MTAAKKETYVEAIGRRKTAVARVRLLPAAKGVFQVNDRDFKDYFPTELLQTAVRRPLVEAQMDGAISISAKIVGGGISSQAGALAHGIARALIKHKEEFKPSLRQGGHLTRDSRMKERRKFGLKKARKSPQWSKR